MRTSTDLIVAASIAILIAFIVAVAAVLPAHDAGASSSGQVVSNRSQLDMLVSDQQMLNFMRAGVSANMGTMIHNDRMWVDPDMIQLQEQYQAEMDRMIGRRSGQS